MSCVGPAGQEDVLGDREGGRVETPVQSLGQAAVGWVGDGGGDRGFAYDESRVRMNGESDLGEADGEDSESEEGGPGPPLIEFFFRLSFISSLR